MPRKSKAKSIKTIRDYWKPQGVVNQARAKKLRAWLAKHAGGMDIATFIHSSEHDRNHAEAIAALIR